MKANQDIRKAVKSKNIKWWQIAEYLEIHESALSRKLRHELSDEEKAKIYAIIEEIAANN